MNSTQATNAIEYTTKQMMKIDALQGQKDALEAKLSTNLTQKELTKTLKKMSRLQERINAVKAGKLLTSQGKRNLVAYSFIAPNFIGFAIFTLGPILFAFVLAFMSWDGNNPMESVGVNNFINLVSDTRFRAAFETGRAHV